MSRTSHYLVPFALGAMGLFALCLTGCRKESEQPSKPSAKLPANSPAVFMNDPVFRKQLSDKRQELQAIVKERAPLVARMEQMVRDHKENLAELQKIDEWNDLHKKIVALNEKYEQTRQRQLKIAAEKLAPQSK